MFVDIHFMLYEQNDDWTLPDDEHRGLHLRHTLTTTEYHVLNFNRVRYVLYCTYEYFYVYSYIHIFYYIRI